MYASISQSNRRSWRLYQLSLAPQAYRLIIILQYFQQYCLLCRNTCTYDWYWVHKHVSIEKQKLFAKIKKCESSSNCMDCHMVRVNIFLKLPCFLYFLRISTFHPPGNRESQCLMGGQVAPHNNQYYWKYCRLTIRCIIKRTSLHCCTLQLTARHECMHSIVREDTRDDTWKGWQE